MARLRRASGMADLTAEVRRRRTKAVTRNEKVYFVYILRSLKDNGFYTGMTNDLEKRIKRHNSGLVASTKTRKPFVLLHYEEVADSKEARQREKYYKSGCGRKSIKKLFP